MFKLYQTPVNTRYFGAACTLGETIKYKNSQAEPQAAISMLKWPENITKQSYDKFNIA